MWQFTSVLFWLLNAHFPEARLAFPPAERTMLERSDKRVIDDDSACCTVTPAITARVEGSAGT
jgi:hypothetical protein